jgi:hypothetical protein
MASERRPSLALRRRADATMGRSPAARSWSGTCCRDPSPTPLAFSIEDAAHGLAAGCAAVAGGRPHRGAWWVVTAWPIADFVVTCVTTRTPGRGRRRARTGPGPALAPSATTLSFAFTMALARGRRGSAALLAFARLPAPHLPHAVGGLAVALVPTRRREHGRAALPQAAATARPRPWSGASSTLVSADGRACSLKPPGEERLLLSGPSPFRSAAGATRPQPSRSCLRRVDDGPLAALAQRHAPPPAPTPGK